MYRLIGATVIVASFVAGWLWMDYRDAADSPLGLDQTAYFEIEKGENLARLVRDLETDGIVEHPFWFKLLAYSSGAYRRIKYGEYEILPDITPRELLALFVSGRVRQHPVTLVEGWTFAEVRAALAVHPELTQTLAGVSDEELMARLGAAGERPEGRFFPDTYFVARGISDLEVLRRAYQGMQAVLDQEWAQRAQPLPYGTAYEALIAASIVEKETARPEERPLVAGVVARRLALGMRLQMDPTVIYGLGANYTGDIRRGDLSRDTPYNTYVRSGLPPTPIGMPGRSSIHAALHPDTGGNLYFVARGDGSHVFSATLAEHQRLVNRFQKQRHD